MVLVRTKVVLSPGVPGVPGCSSEPQLVLLNRVLAQENSCWNWHGFLIDHCEHGAQDDD